MRMKEISRRGKRYEAEIMRREERGMRMKEMRMSIWMLENQDKERYVGIEDKEEIRG